jgi:hypothetical protein
LIKLSESEIIPVLVNRLCQALAAHPIELKTVCIPFTAGFSATTLHDSQPTQSSSQKTKDQVRMYFPKRRLFLVKFSLAKNTLIGFHFLVSVF